jgi:5-methylcytosine-specific restriction endonuclease McrA
MTMKALLLDSSYYPIQIIDWKRAMILYFTGRAEVVEHHQDLKIQSTHESFKLPKVMRMFGHFKKFSRVKFNRSNLFFRDKHQCQYCGDKFAAHELTFDHVMPKSRGGLTSWQNIVACCSACNTDKAARTPDEWGKKLLKTPIEPKWSPMVALRLSKPERSLFSSWLFESKKQF